MKKVILLLQIHFISFEGASDSMQSHQIYENAENTHAFAHDILVKLCIVAVTGLTILPALLPVSYAIFGYPPPHLWMLSLETQ